MSAECCLDKMKAKAKFRRVNGQDLSKASHEEAVQAFRNAQEPIIVEVLRRAAKSAIKSKPPPPPPAPTMISVSTQTDELIESQSFYDMFRPPTPPQGYTGFQDSRLFMPASRQPLVFSPSTDMGLTDIEMANEMMDDFYEDEQSYEMDYEEVLLHKVNSEEKIGLTLCYGSVDETNTDIFIREIEAYSIASQDGRIREGDQILQINGTEVHSREQAIQQFSENRSDISLLLARPQLQYDDGFMEDRNYYLDELQMDMMEEHHRQRLAFLQQYNDEEGGTTDTATTSESHKHEKDSGVGRTDESTRNDTSSEQEIFDGECTSPHLHSKFEPGNMDLHNSNDSFTSMEGENEISAEECDKFRQVLEHRCKNVENSPRHGLPHTSSQDASSVYEQELARLDKEMQDIALECEQIVDKHMIDQQRTVLQSDVLKNDCYRSPRMVPRMGIRSSVKHGCPQTDSPAKHESVRKTNTLSSKCDNTIVEKMKLEDKGDSSSAYNTADSRRSTPLGLTLELNQASSENEKGHRDSMLCLNVEPEFTSDKENELSGKSGAKVAKQSCGTQSDSESGLKVGESESMTDIYARCADVMYTNEANLAHTISVQQKLFEQQLLKRVDIQQRRSLRSSSRQHGTASNQESANNMTDNPDSQMEWVVKKRADGSRYITRRPVRNKMLKERAKKINDERCGMTTDDDAMSELKTGRYWSKEDRKRHLERAKDQKRRKEFMLKSRMETLKEQTCEGEVKKEINIVELSHRKMMRHKGKRVFDDFTTVQEMMVHGSKTAEGKTYNPLLSVTTV